MERRSERCAKAQMLFKTGQQRLALDPVGDPGDHAAGATDDRRLDVQGPRGFEKTDAVGIETAQSTKCERDAAVRVAEATRQDAAGCRTPRRLRDSHISNRNITSIS